jgi:hypothetical protein
MHEEISSRVNSGKNACYNSVQNILSAFLLSRNIKIKIYRTVVLYGCETWSLTLRAVCSLRMFESRMLRKMSGNKRKELAGG